jgi:hypothetical protein
VIVRFLLAAALVAVLACAQTASGTPTSDGSTPAAAGATGAPSAEAAHSPSPAKPQLQDFKGVAELQSRFNQDAGSTRLILLVSPT